MKKRFLSALMAVFICVLSMGITAVYAEEFKVTVGVVEASAGETVTVPVEISGNTGITGLELFVGYDGLLYNYKSTKAGEAICVLDLTKPGISFEEGSLTFNWDGYDSDDSNGIILNMVFDIPEDAEDGYYEITPVVICAFDDNLDKVEISAQSGGISIGEYYNDTTHSFGNWELCGMYVHKKSCACGKALYELHEWDDGVITKDPNKTGIGEVIFTCAICGGTKINALHLDPNATDVPTVPTVTTATFMVEGQQYYKKVVKKGEAIGVLPSSPKVEGYIFEGWYDESGCEVTADTIVTGDVIAEAYFTLAPCYHRWDDGIVTTPATHTTDGVKTFTCTVCSASYTEAIPADANAHTWYEGVVTTPATHTTDGVLTLICACGASYTETIPANANAHTYIGTITKAPTCVEDGVMTYICECGKTEEDGILATGIHAWDEGIVTVEPTCSTEGEKTYTCTVCGAIKTEVIPSLSAEGITLTVESVIAWKNSQGEVIVPIKINDNDGLTGLEISCNYPSEVLTLEGVEQGDALRSMVFTRTTNLGKNPIVLLWDSMDADNTNGDIAYLKFKVAEGAEEGEYPISVAVNIACGDDLNDIPYQVVNGTVTIKTIGDSNGDGEISVKDVVTIRRFIADGYEVGINKNAADVNKDGGVNVKDVVILRRFISGGYGVEL